MRTSAPPLIPLFRSEGQARMLAVLFDRTRAGLKVGDLARIARVPVSTASREVQRLADHDLVTVANQGRNRLVTANWQLAWAPALADLLAQTIGLPAVIGNGLDQVDGVEEAWIFGSWAARHEGEPGQQPGDIDVLVIGDASVDDLRAPLRPAEELAGVYINPVCVPRSQWLALDDPFIETVRSRPMVSVPLKGGQPP